MSSTSTKIRDEPIKDIKSDLEKEYNEEFIVISNNTIFKDASHAGVKGSNECDDKNTIVVSTLRNKGSGDNDNSLC